MARLKYKDGEVWKEVADQKQVTELMEEYANYIDSELDFVLRELPNGTKDEVRVSGGKVEWVKRVSNNYTLTGNEEIALYTQSAEYMRFKITMSNMNIDRSITNFICLNNFQPLDIVPNPENEGISTFNGFFYISILKSKLTTPNVAGFKVWLQVNPTTLIYQLAQPIITELTLDDLSPNTQQIVKLTSKVEQLTKAIIALGGTII